MSAAPHPLFIEARRILLDALAVLGPQRDAVVLIGAQAVYLRVGDAGMAVTVHTTDADLGILPEFLTDAPQLSDMLRGADFTLSDEVGTWIKSATLPGRSEPVQIALDLMVPAAVGGSGRRGARIPPHGDRTARKARGIEAALFDRSLMTVSALDRQDSRAIEVNVAGPAALLVAKLHKIRDRADDPRRNQEIAKDALDVLRLLRGTRTAEVATVLRELMSRSGTESSTRRSTRDVVAEALDYLGAEFTRAGARGPLLAARAATGAEDPAIIAASLIALTTDLLDAVSR